MGTGDLQDRKPGSSYDLELLAHERYREKGNRTGFSFYAPIRYSELPRYYRESATKPDVAVFQVAPMDEHGYFNFGPNASHMAACCETSKVVIVEVNENMPVCLGGFENGVHISNVDMIVEGSNPTIAEMGAAQQRLMSMKQLQN